jgi:hypothetical protein
LATIALIFKKYYWLIAITVKQFRSFGFCMAPENGRNDSK